MKTINDKGLSRTFVDPSRLYDFLIKHHCLSPSVDDDDAIVFFKIFELNNKNFYSRDTFLNALWACCDSDTTYDKCVMFSLGGSL